MEKLALNIKCPHCKKSLMDPYHRIHEKPSILLDVKAESGEGKLRLCAYYGCYTHESTIGLKEGEIVHVYCPHCHKELVSQSKFCSECKAPMIPLAMQRGGRVYVCSRVGCKKHFLSFENISEALTRLYNEYGNF